MEIDHVIGVQEGRALFSGAVGRRGVGTSFSTSQGLLQLMTPNFSAGDIGKIEHTLHA
jgi:hypothetical protein